MGGMSVPMRFRDKTVVITGGGGGIGRTYGHRFAAEGANIVIADLDPAAGDRMVKELEAAGSKGLSFPMNVTDEEAALGMVEAAADAFGGIDILVNNAGIHLQHAQLPFTIEAVPKWREARDVHSVQRPICPGAA